MLDRTAGRTMEGRPSAQGQAVGNRLKERRRALAIWSAGMLGLPLAGVAAVALGAPGGGVLAGVLAGMAGWGLFSDRHMRRKGGIPVLVWHSVSRDAGWLPWAANISVTPETLDRQLGILRDMGCQSMDSADFALRRSLGETVPANTVILHFDDGYLDNWVAAAPILQRHGMRATIFVSLDFIAPERPVPASLEDQPDGRALQWDGYLTWPEIRALDKSAAEGDSGGAFGGVFGIEAHGVDHGRVPTGPRVVDRLTPANWRRLAWLQWAEMPGDKHDWYKAAEPPALPYGTPVPESDGALAAPKWLGDRHETEEEYSRRVRQHLRACCEAFRRELGRAPQVFCWPQNLTSPLARQIAAEEGFLATTGGKGSNREAENPAVISRVHVGERVAGFAWPAADDLFFRATIHAFRGNTYWYLPILALSLLRRVHDGLAGKGEAA